MFQFLQTLKFKVHIIFITPEDRNTVLHSHVIQKQATGQTGLPRMQSAIPGLTSINQVNGRSGVGGHYQAEGSGLG